MYRRLVIGANRLAKHLKIATLPQRIGRAGRDTPIRAVPAASAERGNPSLNAEESSLENYVMHAKLESKIAVHEFMGTVYAYAGRSSIKK